MVTEAVSTPELVDTAAALIVGSELLSGKVRDQNLYHLSTTLRALDIRLDRVIMCPDDRATIASDLRALLSNHDVVFTSGGLGPTHDDVTILGVCDALGTRPERSDEMLSIIETIYGQDTTENHRLMANIPQGARLIDTGGWPLIVAARVWLLPGVPELFKSKLAAVRRELRGRHPIFTASIQVRSEEAWIKDQLDEVVLAHPDVEIGSYPKWFDPSYKTLITIDSRSEAQLKVALEHLSRLLADHLVHGSSEHAPSAHLSAEK